MTFIYERTECPPGYLVPVYIPAAKLYHKCPVNSPSRCYYSMSSILYAISMPNYCEIKNKLLYYAHEKLQSANYQYFALLLKHILFFERNNKKRKNHEKSLWLSPLFWSFPWLPPCSVRLSWGQDCFWAWGLWRGDGCGWDNGVVRMEGDRAVALLLERCLGRRVFILLLLLLGFPGALVCRLDAT